MVKPTAEQPVFTAKALNNSKRGLQPSVPKRKTRRHREAPATKRPQALQYDYFNKYVVGIA
ncbi:MAG: hypothetical protein C0593_07065 [Marinilabiliales bacterium]|nr:MAG: hypothetical protein C0593_07065 [Marinilabiliales bacterium]